ncbi:hypothetical protein A0H81_05822 [Grifola frondosa]|uniref:Uncharacterized protein n=1 Tax=Grifola frondosa TaxID=5627 RepID=A0A1C7M9A6_GRIFR|nr:hypothetical protein A0H81_05822 [Grifola frondosa]
MVEYAIWLWAEKHISISHSGQIDYLKRPFNLKAAKKSKYYRHFSNLQWGSATCEYILLVKNLASFKVLKIINMVHPASIIVFDSKNVNVDYTSLVDNSLDLEDK